MLNMLTRKRTPQKDSKPPNDSWSPKPGRLCFVACLAVLGMAVAAPGHAGLTAPSLGIATAQAEASELGALVTLTGSFPFEDMVARHYGVTLFIRSIEEKEQFVCFSSIWGPMAGATEIIKDGLDEKVVGQLAAIARPTTAARYISIEKGRMEVQLPPGFPPGEAEIQFFVVYEQVPVFSNPVPFLIGEVE